MTLPQLISDLLTLLLDLAVPAATCTLVLAGVAMRSESGINFEAGGRFQRWMVWTVILLTLPQLLSWFAAQGIQLPTQQAGTTSAWLTAMETSFKNFVTDIVVARLVPVAAAFFVLKAALDGAQGISPLGSIVTAIFLLAVPSTVQLLQGFNDRTTLATVDTLAAIWNYVSGTILPEAAGLAVAGAVINFARHKPIMPLVYSALAFLSVTGIWKLIQAMTTN